MGKADGHVGREIVLRLCNVANVILLSYTASFNSSEFKQVKDEETQVNVSGIDYLLLPCPLSSGNVSSWP